MSIHGDKHVKSSISQRQWNNAGGVIDFSEGQSSSLQMKLEARISGACASWEGQWVERSEQGRLARRFWACSSRRLARSPPCSLYGQQWSSSGIERHRCPSYILGVLFAHPPTVEPAPSLPLTISLAIVLRHRYRNQLLSAHSSLNKLGYLFLFYFGLRLTACGILVPGQGIEPRVLGSERRGS